MSLSRIDKILCHAGYGSRKAVRKLFGMRLVTVNGELVTDTGFLVNPDSDEIAVDGTVLVVQKNVYLMMNKKAGTVSAAKDGLHETVFDYLSEEYRTGWLLEKLHVVGRLDVDTEGLLLFTTDGTLTHRLTSPKNHVPKSYFVRLLNAESTARQAEITALFAKGIHIPREDNDDEADCKPASLTWQSENECVLTITEGRYHQVKRMFRAVENTVAYLKRLSIASLQLDKTLLPGEYRPLTATERDELLELL